MGVATIPEPESAQDRAAIITAFRKRVIQRKRESAPGETQQLLRALDSFIRRFVILGSDAAYPALSLFVLHTWAFDAAHATPYVVLESPEKRSGKSRLLDVLKLVCRNAIKAGSISAAGIYQSVCTGHPTMLIDEADAIFGRSGDWNESLRGVLNAGNLPGSPVIRGGKDGSPISYDIFGPKVMAGIATGKLPDTIRDRAIVVPMDRKLKAEYVERFVHHRLEDEIVTLRRQLEEWGKRQEDALLCYDPEPFEKVNDRLEEAWEPLLAIADLAGGEYPEKARRAAVELAAGDGDQDQGVSHTLLLALRDLFRNEEKLRSASIVRALNLDQSLPFSEWNGGKGISPIELANLLKRYRIRPRDIRLGEKIVKGYRREQFKRSWERYGNDPAATGATSQRSSGVSGELSRRQADERRAPLIAGNADESTHVADVAAKRGAIPGPGTNGRFASDEAVQLLDRALDGEGRHQ
jgi:hypothetical protein